MSVQAEVYARLTALGIPYTRMEHAPVHTMADCAPNARALDACMPKNLFCTPRNESLFVLAIVRAESVFRTAAISRQLGVSRLSFASPARLMEKLRTLPGAISPMGLLFDTERCVRLAIDRSLLREPRLAFHPCVNTETLALRQEDFLAFLRALGREPSWIDIQTPAEDTAL